MTPTGVRRFMEQVCRAAGKAGHQLELTEEPHGYSYRWSHGLVGDTNASTPPVALFCALQIYCEINFTTFQATT